LAETGESPNAVLERFKKHPSVAALIAGSETKEYSAHLIPEGGYKEMPELFGDGWLVTGDSAHFVNSLHREGSNMAMTSGQIAAETIIELKRAGHPFNRAGLALYRKKMNETYVMKDLMKYKNMPAFMHKNKQFLSIYPTLLGKAAQTWFKVDGIDKKTKEGEILGSFVKTRRLSGLLSDAIKLVKVWR